MSSNRIIKVFGALAVIVILVYSFLPGDSLSYEQQIDLHREEVNDFMKNDRESPLPDSIKQNFSGLNFFDIQPEFKVIASTETIPGRPEVIMATSDGETRRYLRFAYAHFELSGQKYRVTLFQPLDDKESLFLPFGDQTNGELTYGGGRYLDLENNGKDEIAIDFNLAYNPYCVFNSSYSCPLPPAENQLSISVTAGEMNFEPGDR